MLAALLRLSEPLRRWLASRSDAQQEGTCECCGKPLIPPETLVTWRTMSKPARVLSYFGQTHDRIPVIFSDGGTLVLMRYDLTINEERGLQ